MSAPLTNISLTQAGICPMLAIEKTTESSPAYILGKAIRAIFVRGEVKQEAEDRTFLRDFEVRILLAKNAPGDRRYLRSVREMIDSYMKKHDTSFFPPHMQKAIELITSLSPFQKADLERGVPKFEQEPEVRSTNCFYEQLNHAVERANMETELPKVLMAMRVVQAVIEEYLAPSKRSTLNPKDLEKVDQITSKLECFQAKFLTRKIPDLIG